VKDTGVGIDDDHLAEIYNFESIGFSKHEKQVSLELAVCRYIIEIMGGEIEIQSEEGVGSTFTINLPVQVYDVTEEKEENTDEPIVTPKQKLASYEGIYSLVAEDDPINQILAQTYIKRLGGKVDVVANGEIAVEKFKENDYDIIFMDCEMPVMDGFDAALKIRELEEEGKHVPIVAMTAYATRGDRERCMAAKMDGHIAKPATIQALESVLREFLLPDHFEE
jgi:CheY-like chemotaxis protein